MTYYRIQPTSRDTAELLDSENWLSLHWSGGSRPCRGCTDCDDYTRELGQTCDGTGEVEEARYGVSVVRDLDDLTTYAATTGMDLWSVPMSIIELNGSTSGDDAEDGHLGEELICPDTIIASTPVTEAFIASVFAQLDD